MSQWRVLFAKILSSFNPDSIQLQPVLTGFHLLPSTHTATHPFFSCNSNNGRGEGCHSTNDCAVMTIMVMPLCFMHRKSTYSRREREGGRQQPLAELKRHHVHPVALQQHGATCEEEAQSKTRAWFEALMMQMWKPAVKSSTSSSLPALNASDVTRRRQSAKDQDEMIRPSVNNVNTSNVSEQCCSAFSADWNEHLWFKTGLSLAAATRASDLLQVAKWGPLTVSWSLVKVSLKAKCNYKWLPTHYPARFVAAHQRH